MTDARRVRVISIALFAVVALSALTPLRSYDFFWHIASGRWIVEHRALPSADPFTVASDAHEWINGEWLFEIGAWAAHATVGLVGMSVLRALFAATLFTTIFLFARRESSDSIAFLLTAISFAGAAQIIDVRPSSAAMLLIVLAIAQSSAIAHGLLALFWINIHPSALLAPGIAALRTRRMTPVIASAVALLVNPFGVGGVIAPLKLMSFVRSGEFVNAEWLPSSVTIFPLLYICVAGGAVAFAMRFRERWRDEWWRAALFAGLAFLAIEHVRNQGLFFAAFPLLVAPAVSSVMPRLRSTLAYAAGSAAIVIVAITADHRLGIAPERFPVEAVARLRASGLKGNIYNPDQFGGFLIWSFYPERRALTDGRNELYHSFIPEYAKARRDQRAWRALLARYRIDLAVDEYRPPLDVVDAVTGMQRSMPASLAYWPRNEWALIAWDEAGMVFARRKAFAAAVLEEWEIRGVVPDAAR